MASANLSGHDGSGDGSGDGGGDGGAGGNSSSNNNNNSNWVTLIVACFQAAINEAAVTCTLYLFVTETIKALARTCDDIMQTSMHQLDGYFVMKLVEYT